MAKVELNLEKRSSPRLPRNLKVRRMNVAVAGLVIYTSNVSRQGAQLVCPAMRFPALRRHLMSPPVELVIELPIGRDISTLATVRYTSPCEDEYLIGVTFDSFRDGDAAGWYSYIDWITDSASAPGAEGPHLP
jgi:hypothetical protein